MRGLHLALGFLTSLPVRTPDRLAAGDLGRAALWFPVVGLGLGFVLWASHALIAPHLPAAITAALVIGLWIAATGALHLDGLADCFDGLFVSAPVERRLEILADVHVGAFGVVGLVWFLIAKTAALASLAGGGALLLAPIAGRWLMVLLAGSQPARPDGLGARLHGELGRGVWLVAVLPVAVAVGLGIRGLLALLAAHAVGFAWLALARRRVGGQTGDVLGAAGELGELACLVAFAWS